MVSILSNNSIICIKSDTNNKYLQLQTGIGPDFGLLQFAADDLFDPFAQFEVVKNDNTEAIHLKSRYNDKFIVRWEPTQPGGSKTSNLMGALSETMDNDPCSWACTLFRPIADGAGGSNRIKLQHLHHNQYLNLAKLPHLNYLCTGSAGLDSFIIVRWNSVLNIYTPKNVAFRNDDGDYICVNKSGKPHLHFSSKDPEDPKASHVINSTDIDGLFTIKSTYNEKYWRVDSNDNCKTVVADVADPGIIDPIDNALPFFKFTVIDIDRISLLSASTTKFCGKYQNQIPTNLFVANHPFVTYDTTLKLVDLQQDYTQMQYRNTPNYTDDESEDLR